MIAIAVAVAVLVALAPIVARHRRAPAPQARQIDPMALFASDSPAATASGLRVWQVEGTWVVEEAGVYRPVSALRARQLGVTWA